MWASIMNFVAPEPTPQELLISSIQQGRVDALQDWLTNRGMDALEAVKFGESEMNVLHIACFYGNIEVVMRLLEYFPIDRPTRGGNTCCHLAAMNGHAAVVDMLIQRGASPGVKNSKGQNVFDVAQGLQLRQTLMTLVLAEEQRNGTAPVIAGVTRDMTQEQVRLKNLPPPPTSFGVPPSSGGCPAAQMSTPPTLSSPGQAYPGAQGGPPMMTQQPRPQYSSRPIQPDGFVTTVGNPNLAAKYGNQTQSRLVAEGTSSNDPNAMTPGAGNNAPWTPPTIQTAPPVNASARYVVNTPGFNVLPPSRPPQSANAAATYRPPTGPYANQVKVFNPGEVMGSTPISTTPPPHSAGANQYDTFIQPSPPS
jgi:hypothetical protein